MVGRKLGWSSTSGRAMGGRGEELELLHALINQARIVERGYIDCGTHFEFVGEIDDVVRLRKLAKLLSRQL